MNIFQILVLTVISIKNIFPLKILKIYIYIYIATWFSGKHTHTQTYRPKYIHRNLIVEYLKKEKEKKMLNLN